MIDKKWTKLEFLKYWLMKLNNDDDIAINISNCSSSNENNRNHIKWRMMSWLTGCIKLYLCQMKIDFFRLGIYKILWFFLKKYGSHIRYSWFVSFLLERFSGFRNII